MSDADFWDSFGDLHAMKEAAQRLAPHLARTTTTPHSLVGYDSTGRVVVNLFESTYTIGVHIAVPCPSDWGPKAASKRGEPVQAWFIATHLEHWTQRGFGDLRLKEPVTYGKDDARQTAVCLVLHTQISIGEPPADELVWAIRGATVETPAELWTGALQGDPPSS